MRARALLLPSLLGLAVFGACRRPSGDEAASGSPATASAAAPSGIVTSPADVSDTTPMAAKAFEAPAAAELVAQGVNLAGMGHDRGRPTAPVAVVEFYDYGCPYCGQFDRDVYPTLEKEFVATGKVRWKQMPFVMGMFPNGGEAARAAECAGEQGEPAFDAMSDRLFAAQREWKGTRQPEPLFQGYAAALKLDTKRFAACYAADRPGARIGMANQVSQRLGIRATPTFFINGAKLEGALPLAEFRQVLNGEVAQKR